MTRLGGNSDGGANRRRFLKAASTLATIGVIAGCTGNSGDGSDGGDGGATSQTNTPGIETFENEAGVKVGATFDAISELAQQEDEITAYASIDREAWRQWVKAFKASYEGDVTVNQNTGNNDQLLTRWNTEYKSGNVQADIIITLTDIALVWQRGQNMKFRSEYLPAWESMPAKFKDVEDNDWIGIRQVLGNYFYNTDLVPEGDAAADTWTDMVTSDRWAEQNLGHDPSPNMNLMMWLGEKYGREYFENLHDQRPRFVNSHTDLARLCGAGEFPVCMTYTHKMGRFGNKLPLDYFPFDPTPSVVSPLLINNKAPNPNAALLLCNFLASAEGQNEIGKTQYIPCHPQATYHGYSNVYPSNEYEVDSIKPGQYDTQQMIERWQKVMGDLI